MIRGSIKKAMIVTKVHLPITLCAWLKFMITFHTNEILVF